MIGIRSILALLFAVVVLTGGCKKKESPVMVFVGSSPVTADDLDFASKRKASLLGKSILGTGEKKEVLNELVRRELLRQYAFKLGITPDKKQLEPELKKIAALKLPGAENRFMSVQAENNLVIQELRDQVAKELDVAPEDISTYFKDHAADYSVPETYRIYLVRVNEEDKAAALLKRFRADPAAFDRAALNDMPPDLREINKHASLTPGSGFPDEMLPLLKKGKQGFVYGPIKSKRGLFLFKLLEKRPAREKALADVYNELRHTVFEEMVERSLDRLAEEMTKQVRVEYKNTGLL